METLGILFFLCVMGLGFWVLIFLALFVPFWIKLLIIEKINPKLAEKIANLGDRSKLK